MRKMPRPGELFVGLHNIKRNGIAFSEYILFDKDIRSYIIEAID